MKKTRKIAAMIAAMALTATMAVPSMMMSASAADITINAPTGVTDTAAHTYEAYQIFGGTLSGTRLSDIVWGTNIFVNGSGVPTRTTTGSTTTDIYTELATLNSTLFMSGGSNLDSAQAVADALATLSDNDDTVKGFADIVAKYTTGSPAESSSNTISGLSDGYYLVQDKSDSPAATTNSAKTRYILKVAGENVTVNAKYDFPTVLKKVQEESLINGTAETATLGSVANYDLGDGYNDVADYDIGDNVPFKLYGTLPSTYADYKQYYYKFTDTLGKEFNYNGDAKAYITVTYIPTGETESVTETYLLDGGVTITPATAVTSNPASATTIEVTIADLKGAALTGKKLNGGTPADTAMAIPGINANAVITVEYTAKLNSAAEIGTPGQRNKVKLTYSNNPNQESGGSPTTNETPEDGVIVFTYGVDINKTKSDTTTDKLANAYFAVYKMVGSNKVYLKTTNTGKYDGTLESAPDATTITSSYAGGDGTDGIFKSTTTGNITIEGLDAGKYYITELKAPDGYNKINEDIEVQVTPAIITSRQAWTYSEDASNPTVAPSTGDTSTNALTGLTVQYKLESASSYTSGSGDAATGKGTVQIVNKEGNTLPSTGGMGTTLFILGGGVTAAAAGIYLVSKKRAKEEDAQ